MDAVHRRLRFLLVQAATWSLLLGWRATDAMAVRRDILAMAWLCGSVAGWWLLLGSWHRIADRITLLRGLLLAAAFAAAVPELPGFGIWGVLLAAVLADLLDGWVARRCGGSADGAMLDMEFDQLATLALAWLGVAKVGPWLLLLPAFRYGYVLVGHGLLGLPVHDPKPRAGDNRQAKWICAGVMAMQIAILCPLVPAAAAQACGALAVAALAWSFGSDAVWLLQARRRRPA